VFFKLIKVHVLVSELYCVRTFKLLDILPTHLLLRSISIRVRLTTRDASDTICKPWDTARTCPTTGTSIQDPVLCRTFYVRVLCDSQYEYGVFPYTINGRNFRWIQILFPVKNYSCVYILHKR